MVTLQKSMLTKVGLIPATWCKGGQVPPQAEQGGSEEELLVR